MFNVRCVFKTMTSMSTDPDLTFCQCLGAILRSLILLIAPCIA